MGDMSKRIVIIGAGLAGTTAARELNERGQAVTVIDPQAGDTCERPPLSKHLFDNSRHHLPYHLESTEHITFVRDWALAQVGFHTSMAYALLRSAGVPLGKQDLVPFMFAYLRPGTMPGG